MIKTITLAGCLAASVASASWAFHPEHESAGRSAAEEALRSATSDHALLVISIADMDQLGAACDREGEFVALRTSATALDERYRALHRPARRPNPLGELVDAHIEQAGPVSSCDASQLDTSVQTIENALTRYERAIEVIEIYMSN
jgi:hypothetical protein